MGVDYIKCEKCKEVFSEYSFRTCRICHDWLDVCESCDIDFQYTIEYNGISRSFILCEDCEDAEFDEIQEAINDNGEEMFFAYDSELDESDGESEHDEIYCSMCKELFATDYWETHITKELHKTQLHKEQLEQDKLKKIKSVNDE